MSSTGGEGTGVLDDVRGRAVSHTSGLLRRIDTHCHYVPDFYREAASASGFANPDGLRAYPAWSRQAAVDALDALNISTAMLSISSPGVSFGEVGAARDLARRVNEEGATLGQDNPGRFGLFAALPLPDIDGALSELTYAFDVLKADGVTLLTNSRGTYLGDRRFEPLYAELDRRRAVVFIHPTTAYCPVCHGLHTGSPGLSWQQPVQEFMFETTRTVTSLILSGTLDRYPNMRIIVPHAGAALPVLSDRAAGLAPVLGLTDQKQPEHVFSHLRRLYYDLAGFPLPRLLPALLEIADPEHLLCGSDFPFTPLAVVKSLAKRMDESELLDPVMRRRLYHDNAVTLFPRLAKL
jgi:predicted TIM-barrel fold metal-dependent hydrolase